MSRSEQFVRTGVEMLMTYGLGRGLEASEYADRPFHC